MESMIKILAFVFMAVPASVNCAFSSQAMKEKEIISISCGPIAKSDGKKNSWKVIGTKRNSTNERTACHAAGLSALVFAFPRLKRRGINEKCH